MAPAWIEREAYLMGTTLRVALAAPARPEGIAAIEAVFAEVRRHEDLLSTWRDDSEIARLNGAQPGERVTLSPELAGLLREAAGWASATGGAFDPGVGALVDAWDLRGHGRVPAADDLAAARRDAGIALFQLDSAGAVRRNRAAWLDTGGFGKGAALRAAARLLADRGVEDALLNFGGQVLALGANERGQPWLVPVSHPARRQEPALALRVRGASVSTSSQSERSLRVGGRRIGHVLDPRTGLPVEPWGSVTIVVDDPLVADILSTALLVLGPEAALRWGDARPEVGVLVLETTAEGIRPRWNRRMQAYLVSDSTNTRRN